MTVSVLMPTHNDEEYVANAINSLLSKSCEDWELIVVDDVSTDQMQRIAKQFAEKDHRVKYIREQKCGRSIDREEKNPASLADSVKMVTTNPAALVQIGENARNYVLKNYLVSHASKVLSTYERFLGKGKHDAHPRRGFRK